MSGGYLSGGYLSGGICPRICLFIASNIRRSIKILLVWSNILLSAR